ncbi:MAG: hypothetical protein RL885_14980 [Planctomycetota bacterium]
MSEPETVIAIYRVQADREAEFFQVLAKHHPTLRAVDLVTEEPPIVYRGTEGDGAPIVFEIFTWKDGEAAETAHHMPEVMAVWEPLGEMCEQRGGKPKFEFPHVVRKSLPVG